MSGLKQRWLAWLERERMALARPDALVHLAVLGALTGLAAGAVIILFRLLAEGVQELLLPPPDYTGGHHAENFEALSPLYHFLFPAISGLVLALLFYFYSGGIRLLGIASVLERMAYHQGYVPFRGLILQFVGAIVAIVGGHSVGREGPHVYLGAAAGSLLGQTFRFPNNSIRIMLACGVASGIAASFNTPLAGVIFALEVVMLEYSVSSFIPIILSAGVATALSNAVFGNMPVFFNAPVALMASLSEIPVILFLGLVVGIASAGMTHAIQTIAKSTQFIALWWKLIAAGLIVGFIGMLQPEVLGIGYDTVTKTLAGQFSLGFLVGLTLMKMLATSFCLGLGVPGGVIGPGFFIGATLGACIGILVGEYTGATVSFIGFYALLGMGAMVAAMLQAPLAALTAMVELTYNPGIIMPGMLTIVVAQLISSQVFKKPSLFIGQLRANGLDYDSNPMNQALRRVGVASVMDNEYIRLDAILKREYAEEIVTMKEAWIVINVEDRPTYLLPIIELIKYLQIDKEANEINLLEMPARRFDLSPIALQSNLQQAYDKFQQGAEALYVVFIEEHAGQNTRIYGLLTPEMIDSAYRN